MKFTRQQLLNTFVRRTRGKGRCVTPNGGCLYVKSDHPGCSIGCQVGFKRAFGGFKSGNVAITRLRNDYPVAFGQVFGDADASDMSFLSNLQLLHDRELNWTRRGTLRKTDLAVFCVTYQLKVPVV